MKRVIIEYLSQSDKPVKRSELLSHIKSKLMDWTISDRAMRKQVEELIKDGELIESSEKGYAIIKTEQQLVDAINYLSAKSQAIAIRKNSLLRNWRIRYKSEPVHQGLLF